MAVITTLAEPELSVRNTLVDADIADPNKDYSFKILSSIIDPTRPNVSDISASTNVFRTDSSGSASVVITAIKDKLDEGTKTRIAKINFVGNSKVDDADLAHEGNRWIGEILEIRRR
jgi:hypothetical protein